MFRSAFLVPTAAAKPAPSLAATCAGRLNHFVRYQFDVSSQKSWDVADKLWRAALLTRDAERVVRS